MHFSGREDIIEESGSKDVICTPKGLGRRQLQAAMKLWSLIRVQENLYQLTGYRLIRTYSVPWSLLLVCGT
jgi:hypothetical protein